MTQPLPSSSAQPPRSAKSDWVGYAVIGLLLVSYLAYRQFRPAPKVGQTHPAVGKPFAEFQFAPLLNVDQPIDLNQCRGKITLINLWGPWCGYCRQEMPHLLDMRDQWPDKFQLISVSYPDVAENTRALEQDTRSLVVRMKQDLPVYHDPSLSIRNTLQRSAVFWKGEFPCTVIIDRDLVIQAVWIGYQSGYEDEMREILQKLIGSS